MLSVKEIKERTERFFKVKGVPDPKLDTDILIAHSLGIKRLDLYLDIERPLTELQLAELRPLVRRRAAREPLQYIVGLSEFYGLNLKVDKRVLIPRHETEELVDLILKKLEAAPNRILDLGTGSGAIALALASKLPESSITAVDQSIDALTVASENASALGLNKRVTFLKGNWWAPIKDGETFDLIVSNPPYLTEDEMTTAEPEVVDYEPNDALVAGSDGLDDFRILLEGAPKFLTDGGLLAMETGIAQREALNDLSKQAGLSGESLEDLSGRPRFFFAKRK